MYNRIIANIIGGRQNMKIKTFIISAITIFISLYLIIGYHSLKHIDKNLRKEIKEKHPREHEIN